MLSGNLFRHSRSFLCLLIFSACFLATTVVILFEKPESSWLDEIQVGEPAPRDVFAPISFTLPNIAETERLKGSVKDKALPVFSLDPKILEAGNSLINSFLKDLESFKPESGQDIKKLSEKYAVYPEDIEALLQVENWPAEVRYYQEFFAKVLQGKILPDAGKADLTAKGKTAILVHEAENKDVPAKVEEIPSDKDALGGAVKAIQDHSKGQRKLQVLWTALAQAVLKPNLSFNPAETEKEQKRLIDSTPPVMELIKKNQILALRGKIVTDKEFHRVKEAAFQLVKMKVFSAVVGKALLILLTFMLFGAYLHLFERDISTSPHDTLLVSTIIFVAVALQRLALLGPAGLFYFLIPASLASLLFSLLVNYRLAVAGGLVITTLTAVMSSFAPDLILFALFGSFAGVFATVGLKRRSQFMKVGVFLGLVNFLVIFSYSFFKNISFKGSVNLGTLGLANGFLMSVLIFFLIFLFEKMFKVTTDMTLVELSDLNHPLLRRMVVEAPGTYHHTLMIANLSEAAAEAIEANPLLVRVGAYFHDIGKIANSEFFAENESVHRAETKIDAPSIHERLTPDKSRDIILEHVRRGSELGKKCGLPEVILKFIPEHHGTGVIYFFYHKAKAQHKSGELPVNANDYRYPGPKPQTKETAITLLADSVEATARALPDHSPEALEATVKKVINEKFTDGQLDECPLTLKDLELIAESFIRTLTGVYHTRIQYPEKDEKSNQPKLFSN